MTGPARHHAERRRRPWSGRAGWLAGLALLLFAVHAAAAADDLDERLGLGDPTAGAAKARSAGCLDCHDRSQPAAGVPRLGGQLADYSVAQLERFRGGQRRHPAHAPEATPTDTDAADIAAWFASLAPMHGGADGGSGSAGLFNKGDRSRDVIACVSCHGANGSGALSGSDSTPAIGGQSADYLRARLRSWRAGPQDGAAISVMNLIAKALTDAEIDALSAWLSASPATP